MATIAEELAKLQALCLQGCGSETVHVVFVEREAKARSENAGPKPKTRLIRELDSAEAYGEFNAEFDRYIRCAVNKTVGISAMIQALKQISDEAIREFTQ
jgi:hypothetical protein